jgi:L-cysteine S-thiosulfotransferase
MRPLEIYLFTLPLMLCACTSTGLVSSYRVSADEIRAPLTVAIPDPERGRAILIGRESNCILCHAVPETGERFFGNLGPPLSGVGARLSAAQLRMRIVDSGRLNRESIMPAYYKVDGLERVPDTLRGKPVLTATQIEDVIAYLQTLK